MVHNQKRNIKWIFAILVIVIAPILVFITPEIIYLTAI